METVMAHIKAKRWAYQRFDSDSLIRRLAKTQNAFRVALDRKYLAWKPSLVGRSPRINPLSNYYQTPALTSLAFLL